MIAAAARLLWMLTAPAAPPLAGCRAATYAELLAMLRSGNKTEVVVFSTWCAPCREHVRRAGAQTLLIGAFDDPDRLSSAVSQLNPLATCLTGDDLVKRLGVKSVPVRMELHEGVLRPLPP